MPKFIWIFWTTIINLFIEFILGQLSKTLIKMGGEQKECANNYPDWRLHLFPQSNLHFWYPQSISLLNQYQDIISYQMQFECITFHSGKFLQMCKCVIQPMKRIKNQFYTETFQIFCTLVLSETMKLCHWILNNSSILCNILKKFPWLMI